MSAFISLLCATVTVCIGIYVSYLVIKLTKKVAEAYGDRLVDAAKSRWK